MGTGNLEKVQGLIDNAKWLAARRKMYTRKPYGHPDTLKGDWSKKPWQLDFFNAGKDHQERMLIAANRVGKTATAAQEVAFHMTGDYPDWWEGKVFKEPVLVWTGSPTTETSRDIVQKELLGGISEEDIGTGAIPYQLLHGKPRTRQAGVSNVIDTFQVKHKSGGISTCTLKQYEQGWRKWQGTAPNIVWMDEEPEDNELQGRIYSEALTRLLTSHGIIMVTFTPLLGVTKLVEHFQGGGSGVYVGNATWDDAPHLDKDERNRLAASYPEHEREARISGVPMMGEGKVFTTSEEAIRVDPFPIPGHFAKIKGIDFGIDHPAAVADIAWDRDNDIIYITRTWKKKGCESEDHAQKIQEVDPWVPVSWPHDGSNREKGSGQRLKDIYQKHGVKTLSMSARYTNDRGGSQPVEPIVLEFQERARDGRLKVFSSCNDFFEEYRNYHRKDGKLSKVRDDVLKAAFYAVMMRRFAGVRFSTRKPPPQRPIFRMGV